MRVPTTKIEFVVHVSLLARALFVSFLLLALWNQVANRPSRLSIWPDRNRKSSMSPFVGKDRGVTDESKSTKKKKKKRKMSQKCVALLVSNSERTFGK